MSFQIMPKRSLMLEGRSVLLITVCMGFLLLISAFSILVTDEVLESLWTKIGGSVAAAFAAQSYTLQARTVRDDPSCLSRTQQYLYRRPSKMEPIPAALEEEWHKYGQLHKACSRKNWTEILLKGEQTEGCKYLVYMEGREGLGNGVLSLITAFTYALATGRVLLIDSRKNLAKLLCEPFPESSWVLPDDFPYEMLQKSPALGPFTRSNFNSSVVSLNLQHTLNGEDQQIFCEGPYSSLTNVSWVAWTSNQYFLPNFLLVPSFWSRIAPLFQDNVDHIFTFLSRLLLLPTNETWAIVLRQYWSYLSCTKSRLGVQVRLHGRPNLAAYDAEAQARIMECLEGKKLLPGVASTQSNATDLADLYSRKTRAPSGAATDVVVLVASLQGRYAEAMREQYSERGAEGGAMVRVHTVSQQGFENKGFEQAQMAMVEIWLLSYSDELATSAFSTFGYVAHAIGDLRPYILSLRKPGHVDDTEELHAACVRGQSVEPCTHYPHRPSCLSGGASGSGGNLTLAHREWIKTHLRFCQDHARGWQLVHGTPSSPAPGRRIAFDFL